MMSITETEQLEVLTWSLVPWLREVREMFQHAEEFALADQVYSFLGAFENGMTPLQAYEDFDGWAMSKQRRMK